jgi:hypothetical protein
MCARTTLLLAAKAATWSFLMHDAAPVARGKQKLGGTAAFVVHTVPLFVRACSLQ